MARNAKTPASAATRAPWALRLVILSKVVCGERVSTELLDRYQALLEEERNAKPHPGDLFCPPGTVIALGRAKDRAEMLSGLGSKVRVEGDAIILQVAQVFALRPVSALPKPPRRASRSRVNRCRPAKRL